MQFTTSGNALGKAALSLAVLWDRKDKSGIWMDQQGAPGKSAEGANMLIEAKPEGVWLATTALGFTVKVRLKSAMVLEPGVVVVNGRIVGEFAKEIDRPLTVFVEMKPQPVPVSFDDKPPEVQQIPNKLVLQYSDKRKGRGSFNCGPADNFPLRPAFESPVAKIRAAPFARSLAFAVEAAASGTGAEAFPHLSGAFLQGKPAIPEGELLPVPDKSTLHIIGCDGVRLAHAAMPATIQATFGVIVPMGPLQALRAFKDLAQELTFHVDEKGHLAWTSPDFELYASAYMHEFPVWENLIPSELATTIKLTTAKKLKQETLAGGLAMVKPFAQDSYSELKAIGFSTSPTAVRDALSRCGYTELEDHLFHSPPRPPEEKDLADIINPEKAVLLSSEFGRSGNASAVLEVDAIIGKGIDESMFSAHMFGEVLSYLEPPMQIGFSDANGAVLMQSDAEIPDANGKVVIRQEYVLMPVNIGQAVAVAAEEAEKDRLKKIAAGPKEPVISFGQKPKEPEPETSPENTIADLPTAHQTEKVSWQVFVEPGFYRFDEESFLHWDGGYSPDFEKPEDGKARVDLLYLNKESKLAIHKGDEIDADDDLQYTDWPPDIFPVAQVTVIGGAPGIQDEDIQDDWDEGLFVTMADLHPDEFAGTGEEPAEPGSEGEDEETEDEALEEEVNADEEGEESEETAGASEADPAEGEGDEPEESESEEGGPEG